MEKIKDFQDVETRVDTGANEKIQSAGAQAGNGANQVKTGTDKPSGSLKHAASVAGGAVAGAAGAAVIMGFVVPEDAPEPVPETPDGINSAPGILPDAADFNGSQVPVAGSVNDDMSFSEAFGAA
ncbi:MAG: hypothetical protein LBT42_03185, partial [Tannerella sp.]|nr:hypothetical protein [Tannerella sp.]